MKTINFYRQMRVDGGKRTGLEIDGETVLERFEKGRKAEDSALLWFVDIRCAGNQLPSEPEAAREWLLARASVIQAGLRTMAAELSAGIDFSAPIARVIPKMGNGISAKIFCSAVRRLPALEIAKSLTEISEHWKEFLDHLEILEPLAH